MIGSKLKQVLLWLFVISIVLSTPMMIEEKEEFLEKIKTKDIAIFFYGDIETQEYQAFESLIPNNNQLFQGIQFIYIPASKFKLNRPKPSLFIHRKIGGGDWILYHGKFNRQEIDSWTRKHCFDTLVDVKIQQLNQILKSNNKGFLLLDYGEFQLLRTKIHLKSFCEYQNLQCGKVTVNNPLQNIVIQLMGLKKEDAGISRLVFYNPDSQRLQIYIKDTWKITVEDLLELSQGKQGIIPSSTNQNEMYNSQVQIQLHYDEERDL